MPSSRISVPRSVTEWFVRGLIAVGIAIAGYGCVVHALANVVRTRNIEWAHAIAPRDGRITALLSQQMSGGRATLADRTRADKLAREALNEDATTVAAVATLGIDAQARGDTTYARRLLGYANVLSRRDLRTQIWAIENAVARSDVASVLRHYDIALRTGRNTANLLFPVLAAAISESNIRAALTYTLAARPEWAAHFINYVAGEAQDPLAVRDLFMALRLARVPVSKNAYTLLVNRLIASNHLEDAWTLYASVSPSADRRMSRNPKFKDGSGISSRFDWALFSDSGISTAIVHNVPSNSFEFSASPSVGGLLLQQVQILPPGLYRIYGKSEGVDQIKEARPYWVITCSNGHELGRVILPNSVEADGIFVGQFAVPVGCPMQTLSLFAQPSDAATGLSGRILRSQVYPAS